MEPHQHVVVQIFVPFGVGLGICFSQTGASHNKHECFRLGTSHLWGRNDICHGIVTADVLKLGLSRGAIASYCFQKISRVNIEQQECCVNFCDYSGFIWTFLCIN